MLHSMTGFGEAQLEEQGLSLLVEVRSLNNRFLKTTIKLPEMLVSAEPEVERIIREELSRGAVTFILHLRQDEQAALPGLNHAALEAYVAALERVRQLRGEADGLHIDLASLLQLPGVCLDHEYTSEEIASLVEKVKTLTRQAIERLRAMRREEGRRLLADLLQQCEVIAGRLSALAELTDRVVQSYHQRLRNRVNEMLQEAHLQVDQDLLCREVAIFAERCDINEEVSRLRSHLEQFEQVCRAEDQAGRRLDFLSQEMLREANTIASKANDAQIAQHVVAIKVAIDRLREQIQNVE